MSADTGLGGETGTRKEEKGVGKSVDVQGESGRALGGTGPGVYGVLKKESVGAIRGGFLEEERFEMKLGRSKGMGWAEGNEENTGFRGSKGDSEFGGSEEGRSGRARPPTVGEAAHAGP